MRPSRAHHAAACAIIWALAACVTFSLLVIMTEKCVRQNAPSFACTVWRAR